MENNKAFCILPWVHTHLNTEGDVYPCCVSWNTERSARIGWVKDNTLEELFNSDFMKKLRLDMLEGKTRPDVCSNCYDREEQGFRSSRQGSNAEYKGNTIPDIISKTEPDGYIEPKISSWDIRFSNLCNMKCRSCGPLFSTTWAQEAKEFDKIKIVSIEEDAPDPLASQYENVEKIYFAGGEPLIMPEHFKTLETLIKSGRSAHTQIVYNSNLSKLNYNNHDLIEYWKEFKKITIGVSLDAVGPRAEYIRHGIKWNVIEENLKMLMTFKERSKNFDFYYSPTVGILNIDHLTDMHKYLWNNNLMPYIGSMRFNLLLYPLHYAFKILPISEKSKIISKVDEHVHWLRTKNAQNDIIDLFLNLKLNLDCEENSNELQKFLKKTQQLDKIRNENFETTFPEYISMYNNLKNKKDMRG